MSVGTLIVNKQRQHESEPVSKDRDDFRKQFFIPVVLENGATVATSPQSRGLEKQTDEPLADVVLPSLEQIHREANEVP